MNTEQKIIKWLKYGLELFEMKNSNNNILTKINWLIDNAGNPKTIVFIKGLLAFYESQDYLSDRQQQMLDSTYISHGGPELS